MRSAVDIVRFITSAGLSALRGKRVLSCLWELTYRCNARCTICDYWRQPSFPEAELCLSSIRAGLRRIHSHGCRVVNFTGGEPTLRADLEQIIATSSQLGMWTSMVTNGSRLSRSRLRDLKNAGLDNLFVSLDSPDPRIHDEQRGVGALHARAVETLRWLGEDFLTGHRTGGIFCVISTSNANALRELVNLADQLGVFIVFQPYHRRKTGRNDLAADIDSDLVRGLLRLKGTHDNLLCSRGNLRGLRRFSVGDPLPRCHAGRKYFSIDPFGGLHPCVDLPPVGNIVTDGLSALQSEDVVRHVSACTGCWYNFRAEADATLSLEGCLDKLRLCLSVLTWNRRHVTRGIQPSRSDHQIRTVTDSPNDRT